RAQNRHGNPARAILLLLCELAFVVAEGDAVDPDDGEHDNARDTGGARGRSNVAGDGAEELHRLGFRERVDVAAVDHGLGSGERGIEPLARDEVDALFAGEGGDNVTGIPEPGDDLRADESGSSCD